MFKGLSKKELYNKFNHKHSITKYLQSRKDTLMILNRDWLLNICKSKIYFK